MRKADRLVVQDSGTGSLLHVRVIPRAKKTEIDGTRGDALLVRLAAPPVDGAANDTLTRFLARLLKVPTRAVRIVSGESARDKRIAIDGVSAQRVRELLTTEP